MSGAGSPEITVDGTGLNVVIVAGQWHDVITNAMIASAQRTIEASGATHSL
ncbi:MAG: 6,7-dimethyl-8-ribityllumazine synthase, partial [Aurantimicrobium sp.]